MTILLFCVNFSMTPISSHIWLQLLPGRHESFPNAGQFHILFTLISLIKISLQTSNALRVAAINSVGTFVLMLGKIAVVVATVGVSYEIMRIKTETVYVAHPWAPILIAACFSYLTAHCFIAVYGMAIDTIFLCFCEDSARNDGITRPYYMSKVSKFVQG